MTNKYKYFYFKSRHFPHPPFSSLPNNFNLTQLCAWWSNKTWYIIYKFTKLDMQEQLDIIQSILSPLKDIPANELAPGISEAIRNLSNLNSSVYALSLFSSFSFLYSLCLTLPKLLNLINFKNSNLVVRCELLCSFVAYFSFTLLLHYANQYLSGMCLQLQTGLPFFTTIFLVHFHNFFLKGWTVSR